MEDLTSLRSKLNGVDNQIIELLNERFRLVKLIGEYKHLNDLPIYDPEREARVLNRLKPYEKYNDMVQTIWPVIMDYAKTLE